MSKKIETTTASSPAPGNARKFELKPGQKVSLCSCGQSKTLPYCDNTHREYNLQHGTQYRSIKIFSEEEKPICLKVFSKAWPE